jgi:cytochrome c biogenesis protein CcdA/thiol-disulfide isomerase/thioredoxin
MTFVILAYLGGVLTILSPCILPVLPFVFARASLPFARSGLPMLIGMAITFALVATLAAVGGGWAVHANEYGRYFALVLFAVLGLSLIFPRLADRLAHPFVVAGARLSQSAESKVDAVPSALSSALLGVGTGLLWAPCAGPILGLVLTGAALQGANVGTFALLLAYAAGAATSLAAALLIGGKVFNALKGSLGAGEWVRRGLGVVVLIAVVAIAFGADTGVLTQLSTASTNQLEQSLVAVLHPRTDRTATSPAGRSDAAGGEMMMKAKAGASAPGNPSTLPDEGALPSLAGAVEWLNSPPLTAAGLRGKVVVVDFWTYSCVNCLRTLPYVRAWAAKYKDQGLVVIGVHAPEFAFEKNIDNVKRAVKELDIGYPVAVDNDYAIWRAFNNEYWPAHYFIDAQGRIRHHHFGEGEYAESEKIIQQLLAESGAKQVVSGLVQPQIVGAALGASAGNGESPETYIGYDRAENFASNGGAEHDENHAYTVPASLTANQWGLLGTWNVSPEKGLLVSPGGHIVYRFHARDVNLVLGPGADGKPVPFRVRVDGKTPGNNHGMDVDADGNGSVAEQRLYQLLRMQGDVGDHTFDIEFLGSGVEAFAFTFG